MTETEHEIDFGIGGRWGHLRKSGSDSSPRMRLLVMLPAVP